MGRRRDGWTRGRKAAFSGTHPCPGLRSLCLGPEAREAGLTGVRIFLSIKADGRSSVSHVPFLWQARAPGLRGKGGHGAIVLTLGTVRKQAPQ